MERKYNKYLLLLEQNKLTDEDKTLYGFLKPKSLLIRLKDCKTYESMSECFRRTKISKSKLFSYCQKKEIFMYLGEYIENKGDYKWLE